MTNRLNGRAAHEPRTLKITPHFNKDPLGSVLIEVGETKVICNVTADEPLPHWIRGSKPPQGWLTAEYAMLPGSTNQRTKRERPSPSGRSQEIQRLIGRSLRGIINLNKCQDVMFTVDCDVIQADGGTRTAAITGAYVALALAVDKLLKRKVLKENPLTDAVAAVSVGFVKGQLLVDLDYKEDSSADLDMNIVMTSGGRMLELQGTAERQSFSKDQVVAIMDHAEKALEGIFAKQKEITSLFA